MSFNLRVLLTFTAYSFIFAVNYFDNTNLQNRNRLRVGDLWRFIGNSFLMCIFLILYHIVESAESRNGLFRGSEHTFPMSDTCFVCLRKSPFQVVKQAFPHDVSACVVARNCARRCLIDIYVLLQKLAYLPSYGLLSANIRSILHCDEYSYSPRYGFPYNYSVMYPGVLCVIMTCRHWAS